MQDFIDIKDDVTGFSISKIKIVKPDICPCCHKGISAITEIGSDAVQYNKVIRTFAVIFRCPACRKYFFKSYILRDTSTGYFGEDFNSTPTPNLNLNIPEEIEKISPKFIEIYTQALTAEYHGLTEITGIGLRKSIEFLVKDYLINVKNKDKDQISKMNLGSIFKEIDNPMISPLITASVWIGNDESHYIRKHEDKDVKDMKEFINALVYFISCEAKVSEALVLIDSSKAK